jgi:hypothetical protein
MNDERTYQKISAEVLIDMSEAITEFGDFGIRAQQQTRNTK